MATVDNWGRLIGYTWGEVASTTWGNVNALPYGVQRASTAAINAAKAFGNTVTALDRLIANLG